MMSKCVIVYIRTHELYSRSKLVMSKKSDIKWFVGKQQKYDSVVIGQSKASKEPNMGSDKFIRIKDIKSALYKIIDENKRLEKETTENILRALGDLPTIEVNEYADKDQAYMEGYAKGVVYGGLQNRAEGKWIINEPIESGFGTIFECPYCKYEVEFEPTNYCPNCGAKMR